MEVYLCQSAGGGGGGGGLDMRCCLAVIYDEPLHSDWQGISI